MATQLHRPKTQMRCSKSSGRPTSLAGLLLAAGLLLLASSSLLANRRASSQPAAAAVDAPVGTSGLGFGVPQAAPGIAGSEPSAGGARAEGATNGRKVETLNAGVDGVNLEQALKANQIALGGDLGSASDSSGEEQVDRWACCLYRIYNQLRVCSSRLRRLLRFDV